MLRSRRFWLGLGVSLIFLALFFYNTDFAQVGRALARASYAYLVPALAVYMVGVVFRALRWHFLLQPLKVISWQRLFPIVIIGYMVNDLLPARVGELARCYLLGEKQGLSKMAILATVGLERLFDGLALLFLALLVAFLVPLPEWLLALVWMLALLFLGSLALLLLMAFFREGSLRVIDPLLRLLPYWLRVRARELIGLFLTGLTALQSLRRLALVFATSLLAWLAESLMAYILVFSFPFRVPFAAALLGTAAANLATILPSSQGGVGPFEYFFSRTLLLFQAEQAEAMAYVLLLHAALLIPVILLGFVFLWLENIPLSQLEEARLSKGFSLGRGHLTQEGEESN